jgi:hypothetical protein
LTTSRIPRSTAAELGLLQLTLSQLTGDLVASRDRRHFAYRGSGRPVLLRPVRGAHAPRFSASADAHGDAVDPPPEHIPPRTREGLVGERRQQRVADEEHDCQ